MATLTLSFKGTPISVHQLDKRPVSIGREAGCRIAIDSLAVAPKNAEIMPTEMGFLLLALDPDYPLYLNDEQVDQATLHHGDRIQIGKHTLTFSAERLGPPAPNAGTTDTPSLEPADVDPVGLTAYVQLQSGPQIGRILVLRRAVTRLSPLGAENLIVTRRADGYHLSRLAGRAPFRVDGKTLEDDAEAPLVNGSLIELGDGRLQFFTAEDSPKTDFPVGV
jgi:pSer/pThr/pTyr-binding forkhead associated (FHA) protein